jgi:glycosyltransferase involved in cell wall biosynthesis
VRIAIVGNFGLSGNQTMAVRALPIARALAGRGHQVRIALPVRRDADCETFEERHDVDVRLAGRPGIAPFSYLWQVVVLTWLCLRWRPNVVYCFKPIAHSGAVLVLFRFLRALGLFRGTIALDTDDWEGDGGWNEKQPFPRWLKRLISWQEIVSLQRADVVTAASLELVKLAGQCGARRVVYLPNCLDPQPRRVENPLRDEARPAAPAKPPRVLVYTRFVEYRLDRLVRTFQAIAERIPDVVFVVVGTGLRAEEEELRQLLGERGLATRAAVTGWAQPDELPGYFAASDIALYLLDDNLLNRTKCPMKLLELTAAGVPVVADRVGQASEYLLDGKTGVLVAPGDVEAMADAAAALIEDSARRLAMAEAGRSEAPRRWTWEVWMPALASALGL